MDMVSVGNGVQGAGGRAGWSMDWQGGSGRHYRLHAERLDSFVMREDDLYVVAKGNHVLWVGSAQDLIADPASRVRFRLALDCATQAFRLDAPEDRLAAIWDLEDAMPAAFTSHTAQAA
ncbi:hypothetical protein [Devosia elaeis]|uniref:Uncharacterized protein n=1 Tax=Devosia elaeis TaxID=1770058 RepID=A0A178I464_9HYPH|nr:hypothetical protein [Devosia elaeis]OAM83089.1 hypothetical protein A3840_01060 [Devosia elaeis]